MNRIGVLKDTNTFEIMSQMKNNSSLLPTCVQHVRDMIIASFAWYLHVHVLDKYHCTVYMFNVNVYIAQYIMG